MGGLHRDRQTGGDQSQTSAGEKGVLIIAEVNARPAAADRRAGAAELMEDKDQTEDPADPLRSENTSDDRGCRRARRVPVKALENREEEQTQ